MSTPEDMVEQDVDLPPEPPPPNAPEVVEEVPVVEYIQSKYAVFADGEVRAVLLDDTASQAGAVALLDRAIADHEVFDTTTGQVRAKTPQELAAEAARARLIELNALAEVIEHGGFRYSGRWYASDATAAANISARSMAISSKEFKAKKFYWCDMDDASIRFTHKGFHKLVRALDFHRQEVRDNYFALADDIKASPDPANVDITGGWPTSPVEL